MALTTFAGGRGKFRGGTHDPFRLTLLAAVLVAALPVNGHLVQQAELFADAPEWHDSFGRRVGISSDTIVVGAFQDDTAAGEDAGSAYVFTRAGATWSKQQQLFASDAVAGDFFAYSVAISGDTIVVGAPWDVGGGSAYVFTRSGSTWSEQEHLYGSDVVTGDELGWGVAITGDTIVVGAKKDDTAAGADVGSAYVFTRSDSTWSQQDHLFASDGAAGDYFGNSVAIASGVIVVGAVYDDTAAGQTGSVYVFTQSGGTWSQQSHLLGKDAGADEQFGVFVSISDDTVVVGAQYDSSAAEDAGSAYVFGPPFLDYFIGDLDLPPRY
jgi:hypothetical protein